VTRDPWPGLQRRLDLRDQRRGPIAEDEVVGVGAQDVQMLLAGDRPLPVDLGVDDDLDASVAQVAGGVGRLHAEVRHPPAPVMVTRPAFEHRALRVLPLDAVAVPVVRPPQREMAARTQDAEHLVDGRTGLDPVPRGRTDDEVEDPGAERQVLRPGDGHRHGRRTAPQGGQHALGDVGRDDRGAARAQGAGRKAGACRQVEHRQARQPLRLCREDVVDLVGVVGTHFVVEVGDLCEQPASAHRLLIDGSGR
jgi:hypothetical protein